MSPRSASTAVRWPRAVVLLDRHRLAGERRLVHAQVARAQEAQVGRHLVAGLQQHQVAGHDLGGRQAQLLAGADHAWPRWSWPWLSASMAATALASWR